MNTNTTNTKQSKLRGSVLDAKHHSMNLILDTQRHSIKDNNLNLSLTSQDNNPNLALRLKNGASANALFSPTGGVGAGGAALIPFFAWGVAAPPRMRRGRGCGALPHA
jgi:hypothetical protein